MAKIDRVLEGRLFCLRSVDASDAELIIKFRNSSGIDTRFINRTSTSVQQQVDWIKAQQFRENDYYFAVYNKFTKAVEGFVGLYNFHGSTAEWGRWVLSPNSLASVESFELIVDFAFNKLKLCSIYCNTHIDNLPVLKFHDKFSVRNAENVKLIMSDEQHDFVKHTLQADDYSSRVKKLLSTLVIKIANRYCQSLDLELNFHHIGVACRSLEDSIQCYQILGYKTESDVFEDPLQGIRGIFLTMDGAPRIELLENLEDSNVLDRWLKGNTTMYHSGYMVDKIEDDRNKLLSLGAIQISPLKFSTYFKSRITFLVMPNKSIIELIENKDNIQ